MTILRKIANGVVTLIVAGGLLLFITSAAKLPVSKRPSAMLTSTGVGTSDAIVQEIENAETWDQVVDIAKRVFAMVKEDDSKIQNMSELEQAKQEMLDQEQDDSDSDDGDESDEDSDEESDDDGDTSDYEEIDGSDAKSQQQEESEEEQKIGRAHV